MIKFRDTCTSTAKQVDVETREGAKYSVNLVGLPNGLDTVVCVFGPSGRGELTAVLPNEVIEALHEVTG